MDEDEEIADLGVEEPGGGGRAGIFVAGIGRVVYR